MTDNSKCLSIINDWMSCKNSTKGNLPYDNFSYGYFKYINKNNSNDKIYFDTLDNEYQTRISIKSKSRKIDENINFKSRNEAMVEICKKINDKNLQPDEISYVIFYYDSDE